MHCVIGDFRRKLGFDEIACKPAKIDLVGVMMRSKRKSLKRKKKKMRDWERTLVMKLNLFLKQGVEYIYTYIKEKNANSLKFSSYKIISGTT